MEEKSFGSSHVMQIIYTDDVGRPQTAYLQCKVGLRGGWVVVAVSPAPWRPHRAQQGESAPAGCTLCVQWVVVLPGAYMHVSCD